MPEYEDSQYDFPVCIDDMHTVTESFHDGDKFECDVTRAFTVTGSWPTWIHCPWCGSDIRRGLQNV